MFLNKLSVPEKEVFISLAMKAAEANGIVVEEEYSMIEEYCKEMGIAFFDARNIKEIDEIISFYKNSDLTVKRIILLETIGLMYADGEYDEAEKGFVNTIANGIGLTTEDIEKYDGFISKYIDLTNEIVESINL